MARRERTVRRIDDPEVLKGLVHPLRQRLWRLLHQLGPCTVKTLATRVGADPGQVSYHLRELAKRGWIHHVPELARDRRESWWRAAPESTSWSMEDFPTPEGQALVKQLHAQLVVEDVQRLGRFVQTFQVWSREWIGASVSARSFLFLTSQEAQAMIGEINEVLRRWAAVGNRAQQSGDTAGRMPYVHVMHGFPERPVEDEDRPR